MNFTHCVNSILQPATFIGRFTFGCLTCFVGAGVLFGHCTMTTAMVVPAVGLPQETDDVKVEVKLNETGSDSDGEIEFVVIQESDTNLKDRLKKIELENLEDLHEVVVHDDGNIEVLVIQDGDSDEHRAIIKKHKGQHHKVISDDEGNVEVIVVGEDAAKQGALLKQLKSSHKSLLHKIHDSDDQNVFVFEGDGADDVLLLRERLGDLLHTHGSGYFDQRELAKKLRQLADRLEGKHSDHHSAHKSHKKTKKLPGGKRKLFIEKKGDKASKDRKSMEFKTKSGQRIVIGQPGKTETMVVKVKPDENEDSHSDKKIVLHGDLSNAVGKFAVEKIHLNSDHDSSELAKRIIGRIKKNLPDKNVVVEAVVENDNEEDEELHKTHTFEWKSSPKGMDSSIQQLRKELDELRRELKELKSARNN